MVEISNIWILQWSIAWFFVVEGFIMGNWAAVIPQVESERDINNGTLGNILFAAAGGAIIAIKSLTWFNQTLGTGISCLIGSICLSMAFPIIGIKFNIAFLIIGVFFLGFFLLFLDASMNGQAVLLEQFLKRHILGFFHAIFSFGALLGALLGGALMELHLSSLKEFLIVSFSVLIPNILCYFGTFSIEQENYINKMNEVNQKKASNNIESNKTTEGDEKPDYETLIKVSILCFISYFGEGSVADWSALFLTQHWNCSPLIATFGFVGFQLSATFGRYYSDKLVVRLGRINLLIISGILSFIGLFFSVCSTFLPVNNGSLAFAIIGFIIGGFGVSLVSPTAISIAGSGISGIDPTNCIAYASATGFIGVLIGPPLLGNISQLFKGLQWSYLFVAFLLSLISIIVLLIPKKYNLPISHHEDNIELSDLKKDVEVSSEIEATFNPLDKKIENNNEEII